MDLSTNQRAVLTVLCDAEGPLTVHDVERETAVEESTARRALHHLCACGLAEGKPRSVTRVGWDGGRRSPTGLFRPPYVYSPTDSGRNLAL